MCFKPLRCDTVRKMEEELEDMGSLVFDGGLDMEEDYYDGDVTWLLQDQVVEILQELLMVLDIQLAVQRF